MGFEETKTLTGRLGIWAHHLEKQRLYGLPHRLVSDLSEAKAEIERLRGALTHLRLTAALLLQNAEGCAVNHYGEDFQTHGMPGWLADCKRDIDAAVAALSQEP